MTDGAHDSYTIVILPQPTAKGYQFRVAKRTAKRVAGALLGVALLLLVFGLHYVILLGNQQEFQALKSRSMAQGEELARYGELATDLQNQLDRLKEFDVKLRVMTNLNPPPADEEAGIGGTESSVSTRPDGRGGTEEPLAAPLSATEALMIDLQAEAARQEASFGDLTEALQGRMAQWASTPSIRPVRGWLASGFGKRLSPFTGTIVMHKGIDLATYHGTPIVSPADGRVESVGHDSGLGQLVVLDHGYGVRTLYGHLSKSYVRYGQRVKRGDVIAAVGSTGLSTGPHLHYEIRMNGQAVNPLRYILD
jgi:murein DD-endopeptidase MepM/ murein hydrolase activator NlpD